MRRNYILALTQNENLCLREGLRIPRRRLRLLEGEGKKGFFKHVSGFANKTYEKVKKGFHKVGEHLDKVDDYSKRFEHFTDKVGNAYNRHASTINSVYGKVTHPTNIHRVKRFLRPLRDANNARKGHPTTFATKLKDKASDTWHDSVRPKAHEMFHSASEYAKENPHIALAGGGLAAGGIGLGAGILAGGAALGGGTLAGVALSQRAKRKRHEAELRHHREQAERYRNMSHHY